MAQAVASVSSTDVRWVPIGAALDCIEDNDQAALTKPLSPRRYDRQTLDRLENLLIASGARVRGQRDYGQPDWIELVDYRLEYRRFLTRPKMANVIVAVSQGAYPASEVKDRSAPIYYQDAVEPRYRIVVRNLMVEAEPLLAVIRHPGQSYQSGSLGKKDSKTWITNAFQRMEQANEIPTGRGAITRLSLELKRQMAKALKTGGCTRELSARRIETVLRELKLFPKSK